MFKQFLIKTNIVSEKTFDRMRKHWIRVICDESTEKLIRDAHPEKLTVLEVCQVGVGRNYFIIRVTSLVIILSLIYWTSIESKTPMI